MEAIMTLEHNKMLSDLGLRSPAEKIDFMLSMASHLIPLLHTVEGTGLKLNAIYESYEHVIAHIRAWLSGKITDPIEVIAPLEMPDRVPFDSLELGFEGTNRFENLRVVGNLITKSLLYAGEIQFARAGIDEVPQCLEEKFTDEELAESFAETLQNADAVMQEAFIAFWNQHFHTPR